METIQIIVAIAAFTGLITAIIAPYWRKRPAIDSWDHRYTISAVMAVLVALATMETTILNYALELDTSTGILLGLIGAFGYGYGMSRGIIEIGNIITWARNPKKSWRA